MLRGPRSTPALLALACAMLALTGCGDPAAPPTTPASPRATEFASEAEAFAAAEATYRAYVDALNEGYALTGTSGPAEVFLTSAALEAERDTSNALRLAGLSITGEARLLDFRGVQHDAEGLVAEVCLDLSRTRVIDSGGVDRTPPSRPQLQPLDIHLTPDARLIQASDAGDHTC